MSHQVFAIPIPASEEYVSQYRCMRLHALRTEPWAFSSTYAREAAFPNSAWYARLEGRGRWTFIASYTPHSSGNSSGEGAQGYGGAFIGTASVLTPEFEIPPELGLPKMESHGHRRGVYEVVGVYVHPRHRRRGVARALMEAVVKRVEQDRATEGRERLVELEVHVENQVAFQAYVKSGFKVVKVVRDEHDGQNYHRMTRVVCGDSKAT